MFCKPGKLRQVYIPHLQHLEYHNKNPKCDVLLCMIDKKPRD